MCSSYILLLTGTVNFITFKNACWITKKNTCIYIWYYVYNVIFTLTLHVVQALSLNNHKFKTGFERDRVSNLILVFCVFVFGRCMLLSHLLSKIINLILITTF